MREAAASIVENLTYFMVDEVEGARGNQARIEQGLRPVNEDKVQRAIGELSAQQGISYAGEIPPRIQKIEPPTDSFMLNKPV